MITNKILIFILVSAIVILTGVTIQQKTTIINLKKSQTIVYSNDTIKHFTDLIQPEKNIPFIPVTLNGVSTMMMLDTGAGRCIIDLNQINQFNFELKETTQQIHGVGGSNINWEVTNCDKIEISGIQYETKLTASNISNVVRLVEMASGIKIAGVIGSDFMTNHNAVIDFKQNKFFLVTD
jgi:hypothetical protein